jgi:hypothetical protein
MSFHQHLQELYGVSKFMLFLADQLSDEDYQALLRLQLEYYDFIAHDGTQKHPSS